MVKKVTVGLEVIREQRYVLASFFADVTNSPRVKAVKAVKEISTNRRFSKPD